MNSKEHEIVVYTKENLPVEKHSFLSDIKTKKIFQKEQFALMIFFDHHVPHGYKGDYIVILESLKEVFFPKKKFLHRKIYRYKLSKAIEKSLKVLVFDGGTAMELNERLNILEEKIEKIHGFFPNYQIPEKINLKLDIKAKHNMRWDYIIYDSWNEVHNNFERILKTIAKLKEKDLILYLVVLCDETTKDLDIRSKVIDYGIASQIFFLWELPSWEEAYYYLQSSGVIFSSIYESFPFAFTKALAYNCHIFANDIPANQHIMKDSISYLDPLSIHNMCDCIYETLQKKKKASYSSIFKKYNADLSAQELKNILEAKD